MVFGWLLFDFIICFHRNWYHHGEIDEVVLDSIARADSYWRIAYGYLEMVTLVTSTLPSTWRTTRFPVFVPPREIDEVVLDSIAEPTLTGALLIGTWKW